MLALIKLLLIAQFAVNYVLWQETVALPRQHCSSPVFPLHPFDYYLFRRAGSSYMSVSCVWFM